MSTTLNSKQTKTKCAIFAQPTPKNITWDEVVSLLLALGCKKIEKGGSATAFKIGGNTLTLHRPHPENTLKTYKVWLTKNFLLQIGEAP